VTFGSKCLGFPSTSTLPHILHMAKIAFPKKLLGT